MKLECTHRILLHINAQQLLSEHVWRRSCQIWEQQIVLHSSLLDHHKKSSCRRKECVSNKVRLLCPRYFLPLDRCCCDAFSTVATHVIDLETEKAMSKLFIEKLFKYLLRVLQILRKCKAIIAM